VKFNVARPEYGIKPGDIWEKWRLGWKAKRLIDPDVATELLREMESNADHPDVSEHRMAEDSPWCEISFEAPWPKWRFGSEGELIGG